jgi:hypothetical protein
MPASKIYVVQQFVKQGRRLVTGQTMQFQTAFEAKLRADRDGGRLGQVVGVVAVEQTVDMETGEVLEEPLVLVRHGEVPAEVAGD